MATFLILLLPLLAFSDGAVDYYGKSLGPLSSYHHGISGTVYAVDARTIHIRDFNYDGEGPAAYFYAGNTKAPNTNGFIIRDEKGLTTPLKRYRNKHVTITLPEGKTLQNIKWLSIWCEEFAVNFGDVKIPKNLDVPKPQKLAGLAGVHGVSSEPVVIVDAQTLLIPSFSYDGEAPDAKFWVGRGSKPSPQGVRIPDENGKEIPLRRYDRKTIVLTLPGDLTVFDIGHFGVWCEAFTVDFGHIQIGGNLNVPPSLKMLGVSPQSKLNCEVMDDELGFEVRWAIAGDSIVVQLVAKLESGGYMSFGLSGEEGRNVMIGGDVVVAWVDHNTLNGYAVDYYLDAKSQCAGNRGSCPDYRIEDNTESIRLLNAALINGYSIVTYQRPLKAHDLLDKPIYTNGSQAVIWAVGPLNSKQEVSYHSLTSKGVVLLDFGRQPAWNCPIPEQDATAAMSGKEEEEINIQGTVGNKYNTRNRDEVTTYKSVPPPAAVPPSKDAWDIPPIQCNEPDDGVFYAQMGPTGGKRGYSAITGHVGWGISYYINGLLIPEINVVRGKAYTFVVEGGLDPETPAKFHPFYITDDPVGGYEHKTPQEKAKVRVFAGVERNKRGDIVPTGVGRLCNWTPDPDQPPADDFASFGAYQRTLTLICDHGEPGVIQWTPDENTPDTVYYQCFSHRYLGWKINVLDRCDLPVASGSEPVPSRIKSEIKDEEFNEELQSRPSIKVATRVLPNSYAVSENNKPIQEAYYKALADSPVNFKDGISQSGVDAYSHQYKPDPSKNGGYQITFSNFNGYDQDYRNLGERFPHSNEQIYDTTTTKNIETSSPSVLYRVNSTTPTAYFTTGTYLPSVLHTTSHPNFSLNQKQRRPPQVMTFIRPHRPVPPIMLMAQQGMALHRPMTIVPSNTQHRPLVIKKPVYRVPPGGIPHPSTIPNNIVANRILPQPTILIPSGQPHFQRPLASQVTKSVSVSYSTAKIKKPVSHLTTDAIKVNKAETKKRNPTPEHLPYLSYSSPSSNGFNPGTVILESGFKPIIQNHSDIQKRISTTDDDISEEKDTIGTIQLDPIEEENTDEGDTSRTETEEDNSDTLEPLFVPSPLDSLQKPTKKSTSEELSLSKKKLLAANKPVRQNLVLIRRRPVFSENGKFRSQSDNLQDETAMAAERMDTYYLPPSGPIYGVSSRGQVPVPAKPEVDGATIVAYDGKSISGSDVVPPPPSSLSHSTRIKKPKSSFDLIRNTPQFAPFKGDVPPPVPDNISPESIPQLQTRNQGRPSHSLGLQLKPQPSQGKTKLSLVRSIESESEELDELAPEASEIKEYHLSAKDKIKTTAAKKEQKEIVKESLHQQKSKEAENERNKSSQEETPEEISPQTSNDDKKGKFNKRNKRHAHDGHNHDHDHDHDLDHDHDHHNHGQMKTPPSNTSSHLFQSIIILIVTSFTLLQVVL